MVAFAPTNNATIWHARLGHLGYQLLQQISSKKLVVGIPVLQNDREKIVCQGCQFGKLHRLSFMKSSESKSFIFGLVHTDLMGLMKTTSYNVFRHVMVLIDDYSRYTWVKFLKEKSEALKKFAEFTNIIGSDFRTKVRCLRSDNGEEFMSEDFFQY